MFTNSLPFAAWDAHFSVFSDTILPIKKKKKAWGKCLRTAYRLWRGVFTFRCSLFGVL